ncbi:hypothetical protein GCM10011396_13540 [Undibacterium terreum]|uniref:Uncharacterized protein n=2 Tax=Undibacterium terreum TaxID=1224302 RepID=A0A916XFZ8_9BURK|nr:hypothetical protein GCM10011396_13540 [Undibacterium terreum]
MTRYMLNFTPRTLRALSELSHDSEKIVDILTINDPPAHLEGRARLPDRVTSDQHTDTLDVTIILENGVTSVQMALPDAFRHQ